MIPIQCASVAHLEIVRIPRTRRCQGHACTIVSSIHGESVPVDDGRFGKRIVEVDPNSLASAQQQGRIDVLPAAMLDQIEQRTWSGSVGGGTQAQTRTFRCKPAEPSARPGNEQRVRTCSGTAKFAQCDATGRCGDVRQRSAR